MDTPRAIPAPQLLRLRASAGGVNEPFLEVSGWDASGLELGDDDVVRVESCCGVLEWPVRVAALEPGVLVLRFASASVLPAAGKRLVLRGETEVQVTKRAPRLSLQARLDALSAARRSLARSS